MWRLFIIYECLGLILGVFPSDFVCDLSLFWEMLLVLVFNTFTFLLPASCFLLGILWPRVTQGVSWLWRESFPSLGMHVLVGLTLLVRFWSHQRVCDSARTLAFGVILIAPASVRFWLHACFWCNFDCTRECAILIALYVVVGLTGIQQTFAPFAKRNANLFLLSWRWCKRWEHLLFMVVFHWRIWNSRCGCT